MLNFNIDPFFKIWLVTPFNITMPVVLTLKLQLNHYKNSSHSMPKLKLSVFCIINNLNKIQSETVFVFQCYSFIIYIK